MFNLLRNSERVRANTIADRSKIEEVEVNERAGHAVRVIRGKAKELWIAAIESKAVALDTVEILSRADPSQIQYEGEMSGAEVAKFGLSSGEARRIDVLARGASGG
jgi:hypothetical protein